MKRLMMAALLLAAVPLGTARAAQPMRAACAANDATIAGSRCTVHFELFASDGPRFVSLVHTRGDFLVKGLPGQFGTIELVWSDPNNKPVETIRCMSIAIFLDVARADSARPACQVVGSIADHFAPGRQTLTVTAVDVQNPMPGTRSYGELWLSLKGDPI
jgi:hypothetical protein